MHSTVATTTTSRRSTHPLAVGALLVILPAIAQLWGVTAGFNGWPVYTDYYRRLTDAFLHGQISLRQGPPAKMLALKDPYDPYQNARYRIHDASLYNGKYYLYWGPAPALVASVVCLAVGDREPTFGDQYLVLIFLFGTQLLAVVLIMEMRRRYFPDQSVWTAAPPALALGLGTPMLYTLARSAIYEASIASGQFFLMSAILTAWFGVQNRRSLLLFLAGVCFAMSFGSRISLLPAIFVIALLTAWMLRGDGKKTAINILALLAPLAAGVALHAWYNFARFGSVTELGLHYQLAMENQHARPASSFAAPHFILPNIVDYLFEPPYRIKVFPYVIAFNQLPIEQVFHLMKQYRSEPVTGVLWSMPFLLFVIPAFALLRWFKSTPDRRAAAWLTLTLACGGILGIAPALTIHGATMRYLLDAVPCLTVLSAFGYWQARRMLGNHPLLLRQLTGIARLMTIWAVVMGLLMGVSGYYSNLNMFNGKLFQTLMTKLPVIRAWWW